MCKKRGVGQNEKTMAMWILAPVLTIEEMTES